MSYRTNDECIQLLIFICDEYEPGWIRTIDNRLKRAMLYQLSYGPMEYCKYNNVFLSRTSKNNSTSLQQSCTEGSWAAHRLQTFITAVNPATKLIWASYVIRRPLGRAHIRLILELATLDIYFYIAWISDSLCFNASST